MSTAVHEPKQTQPINIPVPEFLSFKALLKYFPLVEDEFIFVNLQHRLDINKQYLQQVCTFAAKNNLLDAESYQNNLKVTTKKIEKLEKLMKEIAERHEGELKEFIEMNTPPTPKAQPPKQLLTRNGIKNLIAEEVKDEVPETNIPELPSHDTLHFPIEDIEDLKLNETKEDPTFYSKPIKYEEEIIKPFDNMI